MKTTVTLTEIKNFPPLSNERIEEIKASKNTDFSDCPLLTETELSEMKPVMLRNPNWYKPLKQDVHVKIDGDVLAWLKNTGKGYQTRMNTILREAMKKEQLAL